MWCGENSQGCRGGSTRFTEIDACNAKRQYSTSPPCALDSISEVRKAVGRRQSAPVGAGASGGASSSALPGAAGGGLLEQLVHGEAEGHAEGCKCVARRGREGGGRGRSALRGAEKRGSGRHTPGQTPGHRAAHVHIPALFPVPLTHVCPGKALYEISVRCEVDEEQNRRKAEGQAGAVGTLRCRRALAAAMQEQPSSARQPQQQPSPSGARAALRKAAPLLKRLSFLICGRGSVRVGGGGMAGGAGEAQALGPRAAGASSSFSMARTRKQTSTTGTAQQVQQTQQARHSSCSRRSRRSRQGRRSRRGRAGLARSSHARTRCPGRSGCGRSQISLT